MRKRSQKREQASGEEQSKTEPKPEETKLPERGPWCLFCQYEYAEGTEREQAVLARSADAKCKCPGCDRSSVPVLKFPDEKPPGKPTGLAADVQQIVDTIFTIDYKRNWKKVHEGLEPLGNDRGSEAHVRKALDEAEDNARIAHQLYVNLKAELERYKLDNEVTVSAMRDAANKELQKEKEDKTRNKAITEADIKAKILELHPDQFRETEEERRRFELSVEHAKELYVIWTQRCRTLNTMLGTIRR